MTIERRFKPCLSVEQSLGLPAVSPIPYAISLSNDRWSWHFTCCNKLSATMLIF